MKGGEKVTIAYKIGTTLAAALFASLLMASVVSADSSLEISGNGALSNNTIDVKVEENCEVKQTSNTNVEAIIYTSASTGGNNASSNTGGDTFITTGNATATTTVTVVGGSNSATNPCCCQPQCEECIECENGSGHSALISGNGVDSDNDIKVNKKKNSEIKQKANTSVGLLLSTKAKTGKNKAKYNTGGTTSIDTGNAESTTDVSVLGGSNTLNP